MSDSLPFFPGDRVIDSDGHLWRVAAIGRVSGEREIVVIDDSGSVARWPMDVAVDLFSKVEDPDV